MSRAWKWTLGVAVLASGGVFLAMRNRGEVLPEVTLQEIKRSELVSKVAANGRIEAKRKVDISANVMGQIVDLGVEEGQRVEKGDLLLQIDETQLAASAKVAEASTRALRADRDASLAAAAEARQTWERVQRSFKQQLIPQSEVDRAKAAYDTAQAQVAAVDRRIDQAEAGVTGAKDSLSKTRIMAPISGVVTRLPVEEGEVAVVGTMNNAGTVLMTISDLSIVEAVMEVDETDIPSVAIGQEAEITIDAYTNRTFKGTVTEIGSSPIQSEITGQQASEAVNFEVKIQVNEPPDGIRPGFSCSAEVFTGRRDAALAVPLQALVVRDKPKAEGDKGAGLPEDEEGLYLFQNGTVKFVPVSTGITGETQIEVVSGLDEGQKVITGPFRALREIKDGDRVKEKIEKEPGAPGGTPATPAARG